LPDLGILANSSRLLRQKLPNTAFVPPVATTSDVSPTGEGKQACECGKEGCFGPTELEKPAVQAITLAPRGSWKRE
jgi:hypothetical protein